ncbi:MAG: septal ring lytic transglycosylase RlpA family protein [Desulfovibrio sp.]
MMRTLFSVCVLALLSTVLLMTGCTKQKIYSTPPGAHPAKPRSTATAPVKTKAVIIDESPKSEEGWHEAEVIDTKATAAVAPEQSVVIEETTLVEESSDGTITMTPVATVKPSAPVYTEEGLASVIGTDREGQPTASGDDYSSARLTAAHRTLPLGSKVEVTNMENGQLTIVTINDRGPFIRGRVIDLSGRAAQELGMNDGGIARVALKAIEMGATTNEGEQTMEPMTSMAKPKPMKTMEPIVAPAEAAPMKHSEPKTAAPITSSKDILPTDLPFFVQVGAFGDRNNAVGVYTTLSGKDLPAMIFENADGGTTLYRVRVGGYATREEATKALEQVKQYFPKSFLVVK